MKLFRLLPFLILMFTVSAYAADAPKASGVVVSRVKVESLSEGRAFIGQINFDKISSVSTEVSGISKKVYVKSGQRVAKGDVLMTLDTQILDQEIEMAKNNIEKIGINIKNAEKNYKRLKELYEKNASTQKDYEDRLYAYEELLKEKAGAEISLKQLEIKKYKSVIRAPFDAVVLDKLTEAGAWASPGSSLFRLGGSDSVYVRVPVSETLLKYMKMGDKMNVVVTAHGQSRVGTLFGIEPVADSKTKNMYIKVAVDCGCNIAENMSADVIVPVSDKKELKMIPRDAIVKFQGKDFVYTVKDDKATILPINIVTYKGNFVGVDNPYIVPGMPVVVEGNERLRPDAPVKIVGEK